MRIKLLHLAAFGPFTDQRLDFGDGRGLAVVRGRNEAGKTSALRALTQLFYGIFHQSTDMFLHTEAGALAVRGVLDFDGDGILDVTRYKRRKNDLVDASGEPVAQERLAALMGGVDKKTFELLFGIDQERLAGGGEELLRTGGALGESLFSAASGLKGLREVTQRLHAEAEALYTPLGRSGKRISSLMAEYKALRKEQNQAATSTTHWKELSRTVARLDRERGELQGQLDALARERARLERLAAAAAPARRVRELAEALEGFKDAVVLPEDFFRQRLEAESGLDQAGREAREARAALDAARGALAGLGVDRALADAEELVMRLYREADTHATARRDDLGLARESRVLADEARALLASLGRGEDLEAAADLQPTRAHAARLRDLASRHGVLEAREADARAKASALEAELAAALREAERAPAGADVAEVDDILERAAQGGLGAQLEQSRANLEAEAKRARDDLARLGLWGGEIADMAAVDVPLEAAVLEFEARMRGAEGDLHDAREASEAARDAREQARSDVESSAAAGAVPSLDDLRAARGLRDQGWALARRALEGGEPDPGDLEAYLAGHEGAALPLALDADIRRADGVADGLYQGADRVARRMQAETALAREERRVAAAGEREARARAALEEISAQWRELWRPAGVAPRTPAEMRSWLSGWTDLRRRLAEQDKARGDIEALRARSEALAGALAEALRRMGEDPGQDGLESLLAQARAARKRHADLRARAEERSRKAADVAAQLDAARSEADRAGRELKAWAEQWAPCVEPLGLAPGALPSEALAVLDALGELAVALDKKRTLDHRRAGIEENFAAYAQAVAQAVERLAPDLAGAEPEAAVNGLHERLLQAREDAREHRRLEAEAERLAAAVESAESRAAGFADVLVRLCSEAGCPGAEGLAGAERRGRERAALEAELAQARDDVARQTAGEDMAAFSAEARDLDSDQAAADMARLDAELTELSRRRDALNQDLGAARRDVQALDGSSRAAELAQRAQGTAADIQDGLDRYVRLKLAEQVVVREVERYRKANQGPVLTLGGEIFAGLTLGSFAGLEADFDAQGDPVIKGLRPSGERLEVGAMSEGTRDQLYLALRLAGLHRRLEASPPMPFVVDDILVNFDDGRARAALSALADLARRTQVVFFTHHDHLADLAAQAVPADVLRTLSLD
ncbi:AAA family ATPase [Desulfocurvus sp. DL9XJH121]